MSSELLTLRIITPQGVLLEKEELSAVNLPLLNQLPIGIRPGHAPLIAETTQGKIKYRTSENEDEIEIYSGVVKVRDNVATILTSGELTQKKDELVLNEIVTYDRLMNTLINYTSTSQAEVASDEINDQT